MKSNKEKIKDRIKWLELESKIIPKLLKVGKKRYGFMIKNPQAIEPEFKYELNEKYWDTVRESLEIEFQLLEKDNLIKLESIKNEIASLKDELEKTNYVS